MLDGISAIFSDGLSIVTSAFSFVTDTPLLAAFIVIPLVIGVIGAVMRMIH